MFSEYSIKIPNNVTVLVFFLKNRYIMCIGKRRERTGQVVVVKFPLNFMPANMSVDYN